MKKRKWKNTTDGTKTTLPSKKRQNSKYPPPKTIKNNKNNQHNSWLVRKFTVTPKNHVIIFKFPKNFDRIL